MPVPRRHAAPELSRFAVDSATLGGCQPGPAEDPGPGAHRKRREQQRRSRELAVTHTCSGGRCCRSATRCSGTTRRCCSSTGAQNSPAPGWCYLPRRSRRWRRQVVEVARQKEQLLAAGQHPSACCFCTGRRGQQDPHRAAPDQQPYRHPRDPADRQRASPGGGGVLGRAGPVQRARRRLARSARAAKLPGSGSCRHALGPR